MVNLDTCHADFVFSQGLIDKDILLAEITWAFRMTSLPPYWTSYYISDHRFCFNFLFRGLTMYWQKLLRPSFVLIMEVFSIVA